MSGEYLTYRSFSIDLLGIAERDPGLGLSDGHRGPSWLGALYRSRILPAGGER